MQPQPALEQIGRGDTSKAPVALDARNPSLPTDVQHVEDTLSLPTGETVRVRAIRPDDTERLQAFHAHLSTDSIVFRFFRYMPALPRADAERFTHLDYRDRMALVAVASAASLTPVAPCSSGGTGAAACDQQVGTDDGAILGVVRYERIAPALAEVAFVVEDHWQGHGIATALLHRLAVYARAHGITQLLAITMATNSRMLEVLRHAGYPLTVHVRDGEAAVTLDISRPVAGEPAAIDASVRSSPR